MKKLGKMIIESRKNYEIVREIPIWGKIFTTKEGQMWGMIFFTVHKNSSVFPRDTYDCLKIENDYNSHRDFKIKTKEVRWKPFNIETNLIVKLKFYIARPIDEEDKEYRDFNKILWEMKDYEFQDEDYKLKIKINNKDFREVVEEEILKEL